MTNTSRALTAVGMKKCISLTTFKKDGSGVAAPVWFNIMNDKIVVTTPRDSWKVRRVHNTPRVEFATCTQRGRVTGATFAGTARILPDSELPRIMRAKKRRYFAFRIISKFHRDQVAIEITPSS